MKRIRFFLAALFLCLSFCAVVSADVELKFGLYASDKPSELKKKFSPVIKALAPAVSQRLGETVKISFKFSKDYEEGIRDLTSGAADFCRFGPASYVAAKKTNPGIEILAVESNKGKKTFNGVICVAGKGPIQSIADLKGNSFAFGNELSTIGRYLSQQHLMENGIRAADLSAYEYLGSHNKVGVAVARGKFAAGALKESTFKKLVKKGTGLRELASFPNTTKPWIARAGLPENVRKALSESLIALKDPAALKVLKKAGFLAGSDADYDVIRSAIENNGKFFE